MLLIYLAILAVSLWGCGVRPHEAPDQALEVEQTTMIKGIFVLLVFASHLSQYLDLQSSSSLMIRGYSFIRSRLGQLVVVPFLFYSGYGIRCSVERKGETYLRTFPKRRILRTYFHTVLILLVFLLIQWILGQRYSFKEIIAGFLLWKSFGNSNWYLFAIIILYLFSWASFCIVRNKKASVLLCMLLTLGYYLIIQRFQNSYWYDTVFVFCFGLAYPDLRRFFDRATDGHLLVWCFFCVGFAILTILLTSSRLSIIPGGLRGNLRAIAAMMFINLFLQRIRVGNNLLHWLGTHVFECYLLQRLPMIVFSKLGVQNVSVLLFVIACAALTAVLAGICKPALKTIDNAFGI